MDVQESVTTVDPLWVMGRGRGGGGLYSQGQHILEAHSNGLAAKCHNPIDFMKEW